MFSQIFNLSKNFLTSQKTKSPQQGPAGQVQSEIKFEREESKGASERPGMVTTRRQSLSLHSDEVRPEVSSDVVRSEGKKRKSPGNTKSLNGEKKQRVEAENRDEDLGNGGVIPTKEVEDGAVGEENMMPENTEASLASNGSAVEDQQALHATSEVDDSIAPAEIQPKTGKESRATREVMKKGEKTVSRLNGDSNLISSKRQHVRFGSEEPNPPALNNDAATTLKSTFNESLPRLSSDMKESDDDEAPESIHNFSELKKVQAESLKAAQAHESEKQLLRRKRREKNARLKDQAGTKQRKRRISADREGEDENDVELSVATPGPIDSEYRLPALLPESILNAIPQKQRSNPEPEPSKQSKRHKMVLTHSPKPPKDISIGNTTIRVSKIDRDVLPSSLAPKTSSKSSRNVRETWLKSLRGVTDGITRRSPAKFVRK